MAAKAGIRYQNTGVPQKGRWRRPRAHHAQRIKDPASGEVQASLHGPHA